MPENIPLIGLTNGIDLVKIVLVFIASVYIIRTVGAA